MKILASWLSPGRLQARPDASSLSSHWLKFTGFVVYHSGRCVPCADVIRGKLVLLGDEGGHGASVGWSWKKTRTGIGWQEASFLVAVAAEPPAGDAAHQCGYETEVRTTACAGTACIQCAGARPGKLQVPGPGSAVARSKCKKPLQNQRFCLGLQSLSLKTAVCMAQTD